MKMISPSRWVIRFRGLKVPIYLFSPETALHETTPLHLAPTPHPEGRFPPPQTHVGEPHLRVRTHQRANRVLGMGGQNGCPAVNLRGNGPNTRNCVARDHEGDGRRPHVLNGGGAAGTLKAANRRGCALLGLVPG
jgi:hypothetical protein